MHIRIVPIDKINAAGYNPRIHLQPGDPELRIFAAASRTSVMLSRLSGTIEQDI